MFSEDAFEKFKKLFYAVYVDFSDNITKDLKKLLDKSTNEDRISYLSTSPSFFVTFVNL